jgi:hypothetical protein
MLLMYEKEKEEEEQRGADTDIKYELFARGSERGGGVSGGLHNI